MRTPILHILLPMAAGIGLQALLPAAPLWPCVAGCVMLAALLLPVLRRGSAAPRLFAVQLWIVCAALGYTLAVARMPGETRDFYGHVWQPGAQMEVRLREMPHVNGKTVKAEAEVLRVQDSTGWHPTSGRLMLFVAKEEQSLRLAAGDRLLVQAALRQPTGRDNPHQFDYRKYLLHKGILFQCYLSPHSYLLLRHDTRGLRIRLAQWRCRLLQVMDRAELSPGQRGVAEALLLGWKDDVDEETYAHFQDAGITHLLCVSGLHVGIVAVLIGYCFAWCASWRRGYIVKGLAQLVGTWLFVLLTGMAPSALRAGIMFSCIIIGKLFFTKPPVLNSIAVSALLLLMARPALLFDVGFQLSYAAVTGIVTLCPPLRRPVQTTRFHERRWLWPVGKAYDLLCVTTVAQIATLPFVLLYFHQFPLYFFIANMIVVPFAAVLLATVLVMMCVAWWPALFRAAAWVAGLELAGVEGCTRWVSQLPHAMLSHLYFDGWMFALLVIAVLLMGCWLTRLTGEQHAQPEEPEHGAAWRHGCGWTAAALIVLIGVRVLYCTAQCNVQQRIVCYAAGRHTVVEVMQGHRSRLLCDSLTLAQPEAVDYYVENNEIYCQIKHRQCLPLPQYVGVDTLRMMVVTRANSYELLCRARYLDSLPQPLPLHCIVLADNAFVSIADLQRLYRFSSVVIAANNSAARREEMRRQCRSLHVPFHDIALQGAWQRQLSPTAPAVTTSAAACFHLGQEDPLHLAKCRGVGLYNPRDILAKMILHPIILQNLTYIR